MKSPSPRVSKERWQIAQGIELANWKKHNTWYGAIARSFLHVLGLRKGRVGDDWNEWWYEKFEGYRILPDEIENAIELGCGPFTNIRLILKERLIGSIVCSDPLVHHYARFKGRWLHEAISKGLVQLDNHPIEECPFHDCAFDLVVMINVLDHVRDAMECLETATRITMPGGYLVIGQDLTDQRDAEKTKEDIAHPVRIHHEDVDGIILRHFAPKFRKILCRQEGRNPCSHYGTYLFIGCKSLNKSSAG